AAAGPRGYHGRDWLLEQPAYIRRPFRRRDMSIRIVNLEGESVASSFRTPSIPHEWIEYPLTAPERVVERLRDAQVAVINKVRLSAEHLSQLPGLKLVAISATGTDNIDLAACR